MLHRRGWILVLGLAALAGSLRGDMVIVDYGEHQHDASERFKQFHKRLTTEPVYALAYAPDGKTLVAAGKGGFHFFDPDTGKHREGLPIEAHHGTGVVYAPDGKRLYTADASGNVQCWDVSTRSVVFRLPRVHPCVAWLGLARDGQTLATCDSVRTAFWDPHNGRWRRGSRSAYFRTSRMHNVLSPDGRWNAYLYNGKSFYIESTISEGTRHEWPDNALAALDFAPDGKTYALAARGGEIRIVDADSLEPRRIFDGPGRDCDVRFSPDGLILVAHNTGAGILASYDAATGRLLWQHRLTPAWRSTAIAFAPDSKQLASGDSDRRIRIYDVATGKIVRVIELPKMVAAKEAPIAPPDGFPLPPRAHLRLGEPHLWHPYSLNGGFFRADGKELLLLPHYDSESAPMLYDTRSGKLIRRLHKLHAAMPWVDGQQVALTPDRRHLLVTYERKLLWWDLDQERVAHEYEFPRFITAIAVSPDGKRFAAACWTEWFAAQPIYVWDLETNTRAALQGHTTQVQYLAFSPDGTRLFSCSNRQQTYHQSRQEFQPGLILEFDWAAGKPLRSHEHQAEEATLAADGNTWALRQVSRHTRLFDWQKQATIATIEHITETFGFTPDGKALAIGGMEQMVSLWDTRTGTLIRKFQGHNEQGTAITCFSADGKTLATREHHGERSTGFNIRLWDVDTGTELCRNPYHRGPIECVAYAPDGRTVISAGADRRLLWWDARTGKLLSAHDGHESGVERLENSPDGKHVASACGKTVCVRDAATRRLLATWPLAGGHVTALAFADGNVLRRVRSNGSVESLEFGASKAKELFNTLTHPQSQLFQGVLSRDGSLVATIEAHTHAIDVWNVAQRKVVRTIRFGPQHRPEYFGPRYLCTRLLFSPDGRYLCGAINSIPIGRRHSVPSATVYVWELAGGDQAAVIHGAGSHIRTLAFAPDGGTLLHGLEQSNRNPHGYKGFDRYGPESVAVLRSLRAGPEMAHFDAGGSARICENTGQEMAMLPGLFQQSARVAFAADGRSLASVDATRTIVLVDLQGIQPTPRPSKTRLDKADLDAAWQDLASSASAKAHTAIWRLTEDPPATIAFLKARLAPALSADDARLQELLRGLASDHFATRALAMRELATLDDLAEPVLRQALARETRTEEKRRVELLLERMGDDLRPDIMQKSRAVEVLEKIAHADARRVLVELASGPTASRVTREARAALARWDRRQAVQ